MTIQKGIFTEKVDLDTTEKPKGESFDVYDIY